MPGMDLLRLDAPLPDDLRDPVVVAALDGWTDAGQGGSLAAAELRAQIDGHRIGDFDPDALYDYRDRRPLIDIDRGLLGDPEWPTLEVDHLSPAGGPDIVLITGGEPDLSWRRLCDDVVELARSIGARRYVGLGSVPGPVPHTRAVRLVVTSSSTDILEEMGRPHERVIVPASAQVMIESSLRDAGLETVGMWARIPHYVATDYPEGAQVLLRSVARHLGIDLDATVLDEDVADNRQRLDAAAEGSPEVQSHITALEESYDEDLAGGGGGITGPLPTGDQIAAELERFLKGQDD
jgi:proteasome assembly chaperone (PAC2) family protein